MERIVGCICKETTAGVFNLDETRKALEDARKLEARVELFMLEDAIQKKRADIAADIASEKETP